MGRRPDRERSRLVLIGAGKYQSDRLDDLPAVPGTLATLRALLCDGEYALFSDEHCTVVENPSTAVEVIIKIEEAAAGAEDALFVYYVGHGRVEAATVGGAEKLWLPLGGTDVSTPAKLRHSALEASALVDSMKTTRAHYRALVLDSCYSGAIFEGPDLGTGRGLDADEVLDELLDQLPAESPDQSHVFASCGRFEKAGAQGDDGYTRFSGEVIRVLREGVSAAEGRPIPEGISIDRLAAAVGTSFKSRDFTQNPAYGSKGLVRKELYLRRNPRHVPPLGWADVARQHRVAWTLCPKADRPVADVLESVTLRVIEDLDQRVVQSGLVRDRDPWWDREFPDRMLARLENLLGGFAERRDGVSTSANHIAPAEAALLLLAPFLHEAWNHFAAAACMDARPEDLTLEWFADPAAGPQAPSLLLRREFEDFLRRNRQRVERAQILERRRGADAAAAVSWWLYHRWLREREFAGKYPVNPKLVDKRFVKDECKAQGVDPALSKLIEGVFSWFGGQPAPLARLRGFGPPVGRLRADEVGVGEHVSWVRANLVDALVAAAHAMAVEPAGLPSVFADQVESAPELTPARLIEDVRRCTWRLKGHTFFLNVVGAGSIVEAALLQHVLDLDQLAADVSAESADQANLIALPWRFRATSSVRDEPERPLDEFRLSLDRDPVQKLLMGRQLYKDPLLAVRELFQNASDANRYRAKRIEYMRFQGLELDDWEGRIAFTFGVERDGQRYLECRDSGVGMGITEIRGAFSHAGRRAADAGEYRLIELGRAWGVAGPVACRSVSC
jgi:Caspase domain